jgi:mannose-6-phosphate isomerase-like protein (cupin superfamily)
LEGNRRIIMIIARERGAPGIDVPEPNRRTLKVLLSPLLHEGLHSIASGLTILPPGGQSDLHAHAEGEMFYILEGRCMIVVGDEKEDLDPGTAAWGPPTVPHQLVNREDKPCRILWVISPSGRERAIIEKSRENK